MVIPSFFWCFQHEVITPSLEANPIRRRWRAQGRFSSRGEPLENKRFHEDFAKEHVDFKYQTYGFEMIWAIYLLIIGVAQKMGDDVLSPNVLGRFSQPSNWGVCNGQTKPIGQKIQIIMGWILDFARNWLLSWFLFPLSWCNITFSQCCGVLCYIHFLFCKLQTAQTNTDSYKWLLEKHVQPAKMHG